ncbi:sigma factor G inhibitor Gin [Peribacillus sp. SCS-155]|uniref:sigma factor G inhibitor Gin n=1 Tax=Peribacillus sedimenti TaxID=3115297 RepID=UPI0039064DA1
MDSIVTKKSAGETCIVCEHVKDVGIHLYTSFICNECERDLINTDTDHPKYTHYVNQLKKIGTSKILS